MQIQFIYRALQDLMDDIDNFQTRMDEVKGKGQKVIDASGGQTKVKDEVESQLSNLDDSYMSLQATSLQIKVSKICAIVKSYYWSIYLTK